MLDYQFKPLQGSFPRPLTPSHQRAPVPFGKTWKQILEMLERELRHLRARSGSCVLLTAHTAYDVNNNGTLRRGVRQPEHPGVVVKFDVWDPKLRRYLPMSFECDNFMTYEANVQAIAGAMEALRRVDRYAVTGGGKSSAHYEGYKALPPSTNGGMTQEDAAAFLAQHSGLNRQTIITDPLVKDIAYKKAVAKLHPDAGGAHEDFIKLQNAKKALDGGAVQL